MSWMHEIGIVQSILEMAIDTAQASAANQIVRLDLRIGAMTGVVPESLQFAFETLREGTIAAEAALEIKSVPATYWCATCESTFEGKDWYQDCPKCGRPSSDLRGGLELELTSMEIV